MPTNSDANETRDRISRDYAEAIRRNQGEECCGGRDAKGSVAPASGYRAEDLDEFPRDLAEASFGCGNPLAFSEVEEGETVVDLGSGAGLDLLIAAQKVGASGRVIGIDMTDAMILAARRNVARAGFENVEVLKGLIEELPVESGAADWVISNCVINLSPEKERVFAEIHRVLKPGGRLLVSDIVARTLPAAVRENADLVSCCLGGAISEEEYATGLRRAGLAEVEVRDRIRYDARQLAALAGGVLEEQSAKSCCGGPAAADPAAAARALEGEVWSSQFYARKPL